MGLYGSPELRNDIDRNVDFDKNLVNCKKCNFKYSKFFDKCPRCGAKRSSGLTFFWITILIIIVIGLFLVFNDYISSDTQNHSSSESNTYSGTAYNSTFSKKIPPELKEIVDEMYASFDEYISFIQNESYDLNEQILRYSKLLSDIDEFSNKIQTFDSSDLTDADIEYLENFMYDLYDWYEKYITNQLEELS